jgi:hypothetical protein
MNGWDEKIPRTNVFAASFAWSLAPGLERTARMRRVLINVCAYKERDRVKGDTRGHEFEGCLGINGSVIYFI